MGTCKTATTPTRIQFNGEKLRHKCWRRVGVSSERLKLRVRGNFRAVQQRLKRAAYALNTSRRVHDQPIGHRRHEVWNCNDFR